jgi:hypothetical protein
MKNMTIDYNLLKSISNNSFIQNILTFARTLQDEFQSRFPALHEAGTQFIQGQKEAFRVLLETEHSHEIHETHEIHESHDSH